MAEKDLEEAVVIGTAGLDRMISVLSERGYRTLGPVVRDGAICQGLIASTTDLPKGWHDELSPGNYQLRHDDDEELFGWAVGPQSWKPEFFPANESLWRARGGDDGVAIETDQVEKSPVAIFGARPCELAAIEILGRVFAEGMHPDSGYIARRRDAFIVVVECGAPAATCFCTSMGTGPGVQREGFDLAVTELGSSPPSFMVRAGSDRGHSVLVEALLGIEHADSSNSALERRDTILDRANALMGRKMDVDGLPDLLSRNLEHPRWAEIAKRCLACGNCTMVCPTCFCSDVDDVSDLSGAIERQRHWASCFDLQHSYLHGGPVRVSTASRYRQWLTHKLSTWHDQFGSSGCVGCGRCIAWCPVGIDLTQEVDAIRASDGSTAP